MMEQNDKQYLIDKSVQWFYDHWREYIAGPDKDGVIRFGGWESDYREFMNKK